MSIRLMSWGLLIAGSALLGTACSPTATASETNQALEEERTGSFCGGFAGIACPEGYACVDDPSDDCDPEQGGADCGGICQKEKKSSCDDPSRIYVSRDPATCATVRFSCDPGMEPFSDECGCGCQPVR